MFNVFGFVPYAGQLAGGRLYQGLTGSSDEGGIDTAYRIIADHLRMMTVAISDGVVPGNQGLE